MRPTDINSLKRGGDISARDFSYIYIYTYIHILAGDRVLSAARCKAKRFVSQGRLDF